MVRRSRTPQGVRGLKLILIHLVYFLLVSHSARSAWIETIRVKGKRIRVCVALRKECVD